MVQLTTEARKAYKDMIAALEEEAEGGLRETQPSILTTDYEKNGLTETVKTSSKDSEDVPNYSEYWLRIGSVFIQKVLFNSMIFTETNDT